MGFLSFLFGKSNYVSEGALTFQDRREVEAAWDRVEEQAALGKPSNLKAAVIEADKLLGFVLKRMYPKMETLGAGLKAAKVKFKKGTWEVYDGLWYAHKIRNELVHNINFDLPSSQVRDILDKFKKGLQEFGAL